MSKPKKQKKSWYKSRRYLHLTEQVIEKKVYPLVSRPRLVAKHAFFPLLHKTLVERRYKKSTIDCVSKRRHKKIDKKTGKIVSTKKIRNIYYATHVDANIYAYYAREILLKKYIEFLKKTPQLSDCITAYRFIPVEKNSDKGKSSTHFAKEVFEYIEAKGECCVLTFDIKSFFDHISHKQLKKMWCKVLGKKTLPKDHYNIYKSITNFSYVRRDDFREKHGGFDEKRLATIRNEKGVKALFSSPQDFREHIKDGKVRVYKNSNRYKNKMTGIPQGLPISPVLANLYLLNFDKEILKRVQSFGGLYRRYSDDILVVCPHDKRQEVGRFIDKKIKKSDLEMAEDKNEICLFNYGANGELECKKVIKDENGEDYNANRPLNYLGFEFYGNKTLIRSKSLAAYYRKMKQGIKRKVKRLRKYEEKNDLPKYSATLYYRKLAIRYTTKGVKSKRRYNHTIAKLEETKGSPLSKNQKYLGNYISHVKRAGRIMGKPEINRQIRNSNKIFRKYIAQRNKGE